MICTLREYSIFVLDQIKHMTGKEPKRIDSDNVLTSVRNLYEDQGQALVLSENYATVIGDLDTYRNFVQDTKIISSFHRTEQASPEGTKGRNICMSMRSAACMII